MGSINYEMRLVGKCRVEFPELFEDDLFWRVFPARDRCRIMGALIKGNPGAKDISAIRALMNLNEPLSVLVMLDLWKTKCRTRATHKEKMFRMYANMRIRDAKRIRNI